jgi:hypothetical protein
MKPRPPVTITRAPANAAVRSAGMAGGQPGSGRAAWPPILAEERGKRKPAPSGEIAGHGE